MTTSLVLARPSSTASRSNLPFSASRSNNLPSSSLPSAREPTSSRHFPAQTQLVMAAAILPSAATNGRHESQRTLLTRVPVDASGVPAATIPSSRIVISPPHTTISTAHAPTCLAREPTASCILRSRSSSSTRGTLRQSLEPIALLASESVVNEGPVDESIQPFYRSMVTLFAETTPNILSYADLEAFAQSHRDLEPALYQLFTTPTVAVNFMALQRHLGALLNPRVVDPLRDPHLLHPRVVSGPGIPWALHTIACIDDLSFWHLAFKFQIPTLASRVARSAYMDRGESLDEAEEAVHRDNFAQYMAMIFAAPLAPLDVLAWQMVVQLGRQPDLGRLVELCATYPIIPVLAASVETFYCQELASRVEAATHRAAQQPNPTNASGDHILDIIPSHIPREMWQPRYYARDNTVMNFEFQRLVAALQPWLE